MVQDGSNKTQNAQKNSMFSPPFADASLIDAQHECRNPAIHTKR